MNRPPLEVERLLTADERGPITVADHEAFRRAITPARPVDPIDELVADPLMDRPPARRSGKEADRILNILDELGRRDG